MRQTEVQIPVPLDERGTGANAVQLSKNRSPFLRHAQDGPVEPWTDL